MKNKALLLLTAILVLMLTACPTPTDPVSDSERKEISAFTFTAADNATLSSNITATISGTTITVEIPFTADETALKPTITHNGESISPASGTAQDFSGNVTYTVTAEDDSTRDYTVTPTTVYTGEDRYAILEWVDFWQGQKDGNWFSVKFYGDVQGDADRDARYNGNNAELTYEELGWDAADWSATNNAGMSNSIVTYDYDGANSGVYDEFSIDKVTDDYIIITYAGFVLTLYAK